MRVILACVLALATGACAVVGSDEPLFSASDGKGHPALKPGLWAMPDEDCTFDPAEAPEDWNNCANATLVSPDTFAEAVGKDGAPADRLRYVLAGGDPRVAQVQAPEDKEDPNYAFAGLRPLKSDAQGRIIEASVWLAMCEPPPKPEDALKDDPKSRPLPQGLSRVPGKPHCLATSPKAAREAVRRTEAWAKDREFALTARWVRDAP